MELKKVSGDATELRSVIIASSMASCYVVLEHIAGRDDPSIRYEDFRRHWIGLYKSIYDQFSQWKPRGETR